MYNFNRKFPGRYDYSLCVSNEEQKRVLSSSAQMLCSPYTKRLTKNKLHQICLRVISHSTAMQLLPPWPNFNDTGRTHGYMQKEIGHAASVSKHDIEKIGYSLHIYTCPQSSSLGKGVLTAMTLRKCYKEPCP